MPNQQLPADDSTLVLLPIIVESGGPPPLPCVPSLVGTVDVGQDPYGSASDETDEVFVANHAAGTISVVQGITVTHTITDLVQPYDVAYNPANVTGWRDLNAKAWVLDSNTNTWLDALFNVGSYNPADPFLRGLSSDPVQAWFYVSSDFSDQVYLFDDCGD